MSLVSDQDDPITTTPGGSDDDVPARAPSRFWLIAPWVLTALALAVAAFSTWQWMGLQRAEQDRAAVEAAASDFVLTLTNWDARDGLDETVDELRAAGSERFLEEIDQLFGGTLRQELEQAGAVSTGELQDVFVQSVDEREAVVFAVVIQHIEVGVTDEAGSTVRSARIALTKSGDRWLVSRVELIDDSSFGPEPAEEQAP